MHTIMKFNLRECCTDEVDENLIKQLEIYKSRYLELTEKGEHTEARRYWDKLIANLPSGFILGATMITNYRQLKTMYSQRKNHKLSEWHDFCKWVETLPMSELITGKKGDENE